MDYTVILNLILVLTIIIITRISLKINNTNNNLLQQINLLEKKIFDEFSRNRNDNLVNQRELREEVNRNINIFNESIINRVNENTKIQLDLLNSFANQFDWKF
jgi:DNA recombination protein RmuC